jgi:hypothetical protein
LMGLIYIILDHYITGSIGRARPVSNVLLIQVFLLHLGPLAIIGTITGFILKGKLVNSYVISVLALLYAYALSALLQFTSWYYYAAYFGVFSIASALMFYVLYKIFNRTLGQTRKTILATALFAAWPFIFVAFSIFGLYFVRILMVAQHNI